MHRLSLVAILTGLVLVAPCAALGQASAQEAFDAGQAAFDRQDFAEARDLFARATELDADDAAAFLWLGKAYYQLGEVDEAIAAWTRTLEISPNESYSAAMLEALRGQKVEADTRIRLIESLVAQELHVLALEQCVSLLADEALSDQQRVTVQMLKAEALLGVRQWDRAIALVKDVQLRHGDLVDAGQAKVLIAIAKLITTERNMVAEALAMLEEVAAAEPDTPVGRDASYELALYRRNEFLSVETTEALKAWVDANPDHPKVHGGRWSVMAAYLELSGRVTPQVEPELNDLDRAALAMASEMYSGYAHAGQYDALTQHLMASLVGHYRGRGGHDAAIAACKSIMQMDLLDNSHRTVLCNLADVQREKVATVLNEMVRTGELTAESAEMPAALVEALATAGAVFEQYPDTRQHYEWALGWTVQSSGGGISLPAKVTKMKPTDAWAMQMLMDILRADEVTDIDARVEAMWGIIAGYAAINQMPAKELALQAAAELQQLVPTKFASWTTMAWRRIDLLDVCASMAFNENIAEGRPEDNAELTDRQVQLIETIAALAGSNQAGSERLLARLEQHLTPWVQHGHYDAARSAYGLLAESLPLDQRRRAELSQIRLAVLEVQREFQRRLSAGMSIPAELDPRLAQAAGQCYQLQGGLEDDDPFLSQVRAVHDGIVGVYMALEMFDVAAQAVRVEVDKVVPQAETFIEFRLAGLHEFLARRELTELLAQYEADREVTLTPAFANAVVEYTRFIVDHPDDPLIYQARDGILGIASLFRGHKAYDVAVDIYREFADSVAGVPRLAGGEADSFSSVQEARIAAANTLLEKARNALAEARDLPDPQPPEAISDEFAAAIAAYQELIAAYPDTVVVAPALQQVMAVGLEYARVDAWDVADGVYAGLLDGGLDLREPERIKLLRGLCELGKVMPDHARQMLTALSSPPPPPQITTPWLGGVSVAGLEGQIPWHQHITYPSDWSELSVRRLRERGASASESPAGEADEMLAPSEPAPSRLPGARLRMDMGAATDDRMAEADELAMVAIRQQHQQQAVRVAQMRESQVMEYTHTRRGLNAPAMLLPPQPIISEAELARQAEAIAAAYAIFQVVRSEHPHTASAAQARAEVLMMTNHWREIMQWRRAAELTEKFLADNPADAELPQLRLGIAMDYLAWAQQPVDGELPRHEMLAEVARRFADARQRLGEIVETFADEKPIVHQGQWQIAQSFLNQANAVETFSPALARGQYVRAARELQAIATEYHDHPNIAAVPDMMWNIAMQLAARGHHKDAVTVWDLLRIYYPTHSLAQQAAMSVARTYQYSLKRPLMAAEAYLEINASRGGNDLEVQNEIFNIGSALRNEKRWVEALHVLETFADTFPRHPSAGVALTTVGEIHQTNEAWEDAIAAYRRVIAEYDNGDWVRQAKWSIAECTINLSQWRQAIAAYRTYITSYPGDGQIGEAERRIGILKDLDRYQALIDEEGQRKAFDAQFQIAEILVAQLANPVKAIIEYRKVTQNWPESHLADDSLFKVGTTYRLIGETDKARQALLAVAANYPTSPWADDALFIIGQMYEDEARQLAAVTRQQSAEMAQDIAQQAAYEQWEAGRRKMVERRRDEITALKGAGELEEAEMAEARGAVLNLQYGAGQAFVLGGEAARQVEELTASQLADRQDKINAALREAVASYERAAQVPAADKADESLLRMAVIYADQLKDPDQAMKTYREIVRQFSGTVVAEDASWRIAQHHERQGEYEQAIEAYDAFLRNYRRSAMASAAQFAIAENYEQLGEWVKAMDAYDNYITNFPDGPNVAKAKDQINWIKMFRL